MRRLAFIALISAAPAVAETPFDGVYRPVGAAYESWECTDESIGRDGGALAVKDGHFIGVESDCELTVPVKVRDMDAFLYDAVCSAEGEEYRHRMLLMQTKTGMIFVQDGFAFELVRCDAPKPDAVEKTATE